MIFFFEESNFGEDHWSRSESRGNWCCLQRPASDAGFVVAEQCHGMHHQHAPRLLTWLLT